MIVLSIELNRLQGADVAGDEGEDSDADSTLNEDSEEGQLEHARCSTLSRDWEKEFAVERSRDMGEDDQGRCQTTQALK